MKENKVTIEKPEWSRKVEFNLSEKMKIYSEEHFLKKDVQEFIKRLKENLPESAYQLRDTKLFKKGVICNCHNIIDKLAGKRFK